MQEKNISRLNLEQCQKCSLCNTVCPMMAVNPAYPGPKRSGPDGERYRLKDPVFYDEALKYCLNCKRCEVACPSDVKIAEVMNLLENIFESGNEKVVIFSEWERMTRLVAIELEKRNIRYEYLNGSIPAKQRGELVENFKSLPESRVFISTDAGSTGLNLQVASTLINLDLPWNPAVLEQRIARIFRLGQERPVQILNLVSKNSIEEGMIAKLRFKTSMFEGVLDGGADSVFINKDKFKKFMEDISCIMDDTPEPPVMEYIDEETEETATADSAAKGNAEKDSDAPGDDVMTDDTLPKDAEMPAKEPPVAEDGESPCAHPGDTSSVQANPTEPIWMAPIWMDIPNPKPAIHRRPTTAPRLRIPDRRAQETIHPPVPTLTAIQVPPPLLREVPSISSARGSHSSTDWQKR